MKIFSKAFKKRVRRLTFLKIYGMRIHKDWIYPRKPDLAFSSKAGLSPRRGVDSSRLVIAAWCFELLPWNSLSPRLPVGGTRAWEEVSHCKYLPEWLSLLSTFLYLSSPGLLLLPLSHILWSCPCLPLSFLFAVARFQVEDLPFLFTNASPITLTHSGGHIYLPMKFVTQFVSRTG